MNDFFVLRLRHISFSFSPCESAKSLQLQQMAVFWKPVTERMTLMDKRKRERRKKVTGTE